MPHFDAPDDIPLDAAGPIPADNRPGHHPEVEQDKPTGPPPSPKSAAERSAAEPSPSERSADVGPAAQRRRFPFEFDGLAGSAARLFTLNGRHAHVDIEDTDLVARYGAWVVRTPLDNITGATVTGPYRLWKVIGPPHLSFHDRGLTFGSNTRSGLCLTFATPVRGLDPTGRLTHPGLTVTVDDPHGLADALGY